MQFGLGGSVPTGSELKRGRGVMVVGLSALALALVVGLVLLLRGDGTEAYRTLGRNINEAKQQSFDSFWTCVLRRDRPLSSNTELEGALHARLSEEGAAFVGRGRAQCAPHLEALETRLNSLILPTEYVQSVQGLVASTRALRGGFSDLLAKIEADGYEHDAVQPSVHVLARAWFDFRTGVQSLNEQLSAQLGS